MAKLLKELHKNVNLTYVKIKLTPKLKEAYEDYSSKGEEEIFIVGSMMGDFFISPDPPEIGIRRNLYPMPLSIQPSDLLECEVLEILKNKEI